MSKSQKPARARRGGAPPSCERRNSDLRLVHPDPVLGPKENLSHLLRGASSLEILRRIENGDPLSIERRVVTRVQRRAVLVELNDVVSRAFARIAYSAPRYSGQPDLDAWLEVLIDKAINAVTLEAQEASGSPLAPDSGNSLYLGLAGSLGVAVATVRQMCIVFNGLPISVRRTFFAIHMLGKTFGQCEAEGLGTLEDLQRRYRAAVRSMSLLRPTGIQLSDGAVEDD